jgi:hypothetical protein
MFESGSCFRIGDELKKARRYLVNRTSSVGVAVTPTTQYKKAHCLELQFIDNALY